MKVIDLLNKIANGEDVPKKIIVDEDKHYYNKDLKEYINQRTGEKLFEDGYGKYLKYFLNDEIEIIEDTPKKDKINKLNDYQICQENYFKIIDKINEIIDEINGENNE